MKGRKIAVVGLGIIITIIIGVMVGLTKKIMFQLAQKPDSVKDLTEKQIVLACVQRAAEEVNAIPNNEFARKRLAWGSVKRSRVDGVNSIPSLLRFIEDLGEPSMVVMKPGTNFPLLKFEVAPPHRAVTAVVRIKDLELHNQDPRYAAGISPCVLPKKTAAGIVWEYHMHAPKIYPIKTEAVTFILTADWTNLIEWFAGEEMSLWEPNSSLGSQWVHLSVDLVLENILNNKKKYGHPRPFVQTPRAFVPSAPPCPQPKAVLATA